MTLPRRGARIVATLIDIACMLPWIAVVAAAGAVLWTAGVTRDLDQLVGNAIGFVTLIVPITLAASGFDATEQHATPGKRALGLRIASAGDASEGDASKGDRPEGDGRRGDGLAGDGPGFARVLLRNAIKYALPWELGHTAVFALFGTTSAPPLWVTIVLIAAYGIPIVSLVMLLVTGRALHDRVARTGVVAAAA